MPGLRSATRAVRTLRFGRAWARISPWTGDPDAARLVVSPDAPLDARAVRECMDRARSLGYRSVVTNALSDAEASAFVASGFGVHEHLYLLAADVGATPLRAGPAVDRVGRREHGMVLAVDAAAFSPSWRLGPTGLRDALAATPRRQFRATRDPDAVITGYAITGLAGRQGYLQRLAAHPHHRREGVGRALVADCFRYLRRNGANRATVNTQYDNAAALALYESCGFTRLPAHLTVMERSL